MSQRGGVKWTNLIWFHRYLSGRSRQKSHDRDVYGTTRTLHVELCREFTSQYTCSLVLNLVPGIDSGTKRDYSWYKLSEVFTKRDLGVYPTQKPLCRIRGVSPHTHTSRCPLSCWQPLLQTPIPINHDSIFLTFHLLFSLFMSFLSGSDHVFKVYTT